MRILIAILFIAASVTPAMAISDKERRDAFAWFESLKYPDVKDKPFVRVATGEWSQTGNEEPVNSWIEGFLLAEEAGGKFTVLTIHLTTETFEKTKADAPAHERVDFQRLELNKWAEAMFAQQRKIAADDKGERRYWKDTWPERVVARKTRLFYVAHALDKRGHADLAEELCDFAAGLVDVDDEASDSTVRSFLDSLHVDLAGLHLERIRDMYWGTEVERQVILAAYEKFVRDFGGRECVEGAVADARYSAALLAQMVEEDRAHAKRARKTWEESTTRERVAELVFQLRNTEMMDDVFTGFKTEKGLAELFEEIGLPAVPALIDAVNDRRFARRQGQARPFDFHNGIKRVGDEALEALEAIAARRFRNSDEPDADVRPALEAWWEDVRTHGYKHVLIQGIERDRGNAQLLAQRLVARFPLDAPEVLLRAIARHDSFVNARRSLIEIAVDLKDERIDAALTRMMTRENLPYWRRVAAMAMHTRGSKESVPLMLRELAVLPRIKPLEEDDRYATVEWLCKCGDPQAIEGLARLLPEFEPALRVTAITHIDEHEMLGRTVYYSQSLHRDAMRRAVMAPALEAWLIGCMGDRDAYKGYSTSVYQQGVNIRAQSPRVCDMAANRLGRLFPAKYAAMFDMAATQRQRDRQCEAMLERWRAERLKR